MTTPSVDPLAKLAGTYDASSFAPQETAPPRAADDPRSAEERLAEAYERGAKEHPEPERAAPPRQPAPDEDPDQDDAADDDDDDDVDDRRQAQPTRHAIDPATVAEFTTVAHELNIGDEAAEKIVARMAPVLARRQAEQIDGVIETWRSEVEGDAEVGGRRLNETVDFAQRALDLVGTPALRQLLGPTSKGGSGLGDHVEILRLLRRVGERLGGSARAPAALPARSAAHRRARRGNTPPRPAEDPLTRLSKTYATTDEPPQRSTHRPPPPPKDPLERLQAAYERGARR